MKKTIFAAAIALLANTEVFAAHVVEPTRYFTVGADINDLQDPPVSFLETIEDSSILFITSVQVGLHLVGTSAGNGFASEMFVALNKDLSVTSILLNQVGLTEENPMGSFYDGWNVTFSDYAANGDIHVAELESGHMTGHWQPDGRTDALSSTRTQMLSIFNGGTGNGEWRMVVGDLFVGGTMRLEGWSLTLEGETEIPTGVPETSSNLLIGALMLGGLLIHSRRNRSIKA